MPRSNINQVPTVQEFIDVFPKELSGLPPKREVELAIEVTAGTTPISIAPYRKTPTKLKAQLQELLDWRFIRLNVSPWRAPMLFVKKKNGTL